MNPPSQKSQSVITGSNSGLLRGNLSSFITCKHSDIVIFLFSFKEFLKMNVHLDLYSYLSDDKMATVKRLFKDYLVKGGFTAG